MKSLTSINVDGDDQQVWEIYTDASREQTFGFVFSDADAEWIETMLLEAGRLDKAFQSSMPNEKVRVS